MTTTTKPTVGTAVEVDPFATPGLTVVAPDGGAPAPTFGAVKPEGDSKSAEGNKSAEGDGHKPLHADKPVAPQAEMPSYTVVELYGCEVLKPMLQNTLALVFDECFIGKFAPGDFVGFWKACLSASNLAFGIAKGMGDSPDARDVKRLAMALKGLYAEGLCSDSLLTAYAVLKGCLFPERVRLDFQSACFQAKRGVEAAIAANPQAVPMAEALHNFDTGEWAAHKAHVANVQARNRAWYESQQKGE